MSVLFESKNAERSNDSGDTEVIVVRPGYPITERSRMLHAAVDVHFLFFVGGFEPIELQNACEGFLQALA